MKYPGAGLARETKEIIFSDFDMNLTQNPVNRDVTRLTNRDAIRQALKNLILTNHWEKPFNGEYGGNIVYYLFEPISDFTAFQIQNELSNAIINFEPRVELLNILVVGSPDENGYNVNIVYRLVNTAKSDELNILLERVR